MKNNNIKKEYSKREIIILSYLENIGFPMDELGTYLYKDIINKTITLLDESLEENIIKEKLNSYYSEIYKDIAVQDKKIGLKKFHTKINESISKLSNKKDYITNTNNINYGYLAFQIAKYIYITHYNNENTKKLKKIN